MKTLTKINIKQFIPTSNNEFAWAGQISDFPKQEGSIARILILYDYDISHRYKRIRLDAELKHIDISLIDNPTDVSNKYNGKLEDWIISNSYEIVNRDERGYMIQNPKYIPEDNREIGKVYTKEETEPYVTEKAFDRFSNMMKTYGVPLINLFEKIVVTDDMINNLFDTYKPLIEELHKPPLYVNP